jgi:hypothetical protein
LVLNIKSKKEFSIRKINVLVNACLITLTLSKSSFAFATSCGQNFNTVGFLGVDGKNGITYCNLSEHDGGCGKNAIRFLPANADIDKILSILMAAKLIQ